jgi:hypothetical protein
LVGGMTVIPPMPVQDVERQVLKHALNLLAVEGPRSGHAEKLSSRDDGKVGV